MKLGEVISSSWKTLFKRYGITLLTFLAWFVISLGLGVISIIPIVGAIAMYVILIPIQAGLRKQFVALYNGEDVHPFDFLKLGFDKFGMVWRVFGRLLLKYLIPIILFIAAYICIGIDQFGAFLNMVYDDSTIGNTDLFAIVGVILFVVSIAWCFDLSLKYIFAYNELAHNENAKTGKEIVETTAQNMKGNTGKLLLLYLVLTLITVVAIFIGACIPIVGILLIIFILCPFVQYVTVAFYEHVRREKMPDYEVTENMDIGGENSSDEPMQNI